jgi:hypothetical protein
MESSLRVLLVKSLDEPASAQVPTINLLRAKSEGQELDFLAIIIIADSVLLVMSPL